MKIFGRKSIQVILSFVFAGTLLQARWYFNKPDYSSVDISKNKVLSISEAVFLHQIENGFNGEKIEPERKFLLKVLDGYPERSFYKTLDERTLADVDRGWVRASEGHEILASLFVDDIFFRNDQIYVTSTIEYCYDKVDGIEYKILKTESGWDVSQMEYSLLNLDASSDNKVVQRANLRCTKIIR